MFLILGEGPHKGLATMEKRKYSLTAAALSVAVILCCALTGTAQAQFDILKSAKEAIGLFDGSTGGAGALTDAEIGDGLIEALKIGTERVVGQVGTADGYNLDPEVARSTSQMAAMIDGRNTNRISTAMRNRRRFRAILSAPGLARCTAAKASIPARYSGLFSSAVSASVLPTTSRSLARLPTSKSLFK